MILRLVFFESEHVLAGLGNATLHFRAVTQLNSYARLATDVSSCNLCLHLSHSLGICRELLAQRQWTERHQNEHECQRESQYSVHHILQEVVRVALDVLKTEERLDL